MREIRELLEIMKKLRDPEAGCPWDKEQTIQSLVPFTLEETYELIDAVERNDTHDLCAELGDLLFHIVYYAQLANEAGHFDFHDISAKINTKLRRRHPHVFGDAKVRTSAEQSIAWEKIKQQERQEKDITEGSILDDVGLNMPAMIRAIKLQKRVATVGFDWQDLGPVIDKIEEEIGELKVELESGAKPERIMDEIGDLLFACLNLARHSEIDPESALRHANRKFERRFRYIELELAKQKKGLSDVTLNEMEELWQQAKKTDLN